MDTSILPIFLLCLHKDSKPKIVEEKVGNLSQNDWKSLITVSGKLGVKSSFYYRLKTLNLCSMVPDELLDELRKAYLSNAARNIIITNEVSQIAREFHSFGISLIVLKGAFLSAFVYENPASREMSDIDLLVRAADLGQAAGVLQRLGYQAEKPFKIEDALSVSHHLPPFIKPGKGVVELHWNIISLVGNDPVDADGLWQRSIYFNRNGAPISGLCPEDLLLHICGHASYHHKFEVGLRACVDVLEITNHYNNSFDWNQFVQRTFDWHWDRGVYLVLRLAKELLGAEIPEEVLRDLRPEDFKEFLFEIARSQILSDDPLIGTITYPLADWHVANLWGKISIFWHRLFLPKPILADRFRILPDSPLIYFYYPIRFFDLLFRYIGKTLKLWRGDESTAPFVERKGLLQEWMHKKE